ncbi:MAG: hypothetical protein IKB71_09360 [Lentisphaeria bacterium]|nr:hypothetical protein [Lentisphaeria bacterium]
MHFIDWLIIAFMFAGTIALTVYFRKFNRGVTDFMVASRMAGPYILAMAPGLCAAVTLVAMGEATYNNGISSGWWGALGLPISIILSLSGFVTYRLRQTKALTLSQFLEERYSRKFRFFAGILCWVSGVLNYGVMPMATGRAVIALCGLPESFRFLNMTWQTFPLVVFIFLAVACFVACAGGQISIIMTGFFQSFICFIAFFIVMYFVFYKFKWATLIEGLKVVPDPENQSLLNPFKAFDADGFNIWYYVIAIIFNAYCRGCWQGGAGFGAAAKTPHDNIMAGVISRWKTYSFLLVILFVPLAAYAVFHLPQYAEFAAPMQTQLNAVADETVRNQMRIPLFMSYLLPTGVLGLFIAGILGSTIVCDDSYMHSWGTIFVQDIIMPLRKKPFEPKQHLLYLRLGIIGVALFSFFFSIYFPLKDFINMYFMITGAIYMGGAGAVVIGGLYWKRGSTPAAWTALICGTIVCVGGVICQSFWQYIAPAMLEYFPGNEFFMAKKFPISSPILTLSTMIISVGSYVLVSLLGPEHIHNMDKLLHRGIYADESPQDKKKAEKIPVWKKLVGISNEHTKFERILVYTSFMIPMADWILFVIITILAISYSTFSEDFWGWLTFWRRIPLYFVCGTICTIWILCGGVRDAVNLVKDLRNTKVNEDDDGFVK